MMALRCFWLIFEPVTSEATFCSSITFQSMNCSISGWSVSTITILAARRVVPPDLIAPGGAVADLEKAHQPRRFAAARQALALASQSGEIRSRAGAVFEKARLTHPQIHDAAFVHQIVGNGLDEAGMRLRMLVGRLRLGELARLEVDVKMPLARAIDAVGPVQAGVEPLRRVRRRHLHGKHVDELVEEGARIRFRIEIAAFPSPIGPGAGKPLENLLCGMLTRAALLLRQGFKSLIDPRSSAKARAEWSLPRPS